MSFNMLGLIIDKETEFTVADLKEKFTTYFSNTVDFSIEYEEAQFDGDEKNLVLRWGDWWTRVFYETGSYVHDDSIEIAEVMVQKCSIDGLSDVDKRIRVLFFDDNDKKYTNEILYIIEFLEDLPGVIVYDPNRIEFVD